ncbi:MAG: hypothetical protein E7680_07710 [Ruminococcaceae bacterium]|nr:hypothetical protein [Oscillospiraceae bacterium]
MKKSFLCILLAFALVLLLTSCFPKNDQQEQTPNEEKGKTESPVDEKQGETDTRQPDNDTQTGDEQGSGKNDPDKEGKDETNTSDPDDQSGEQSSGNTQTDDEHSDDGQSNSPVIVLPKDHF